MKMTEELSNFLPVNTPNSTHITNYKLQYTSFVQSIMQAQKLLGPNQMAFSDNANIANFSGLQSHYGYGEVRNPFSPTTNLPADPIDMSTRRSYHLANINEDEAEPTNVRPANYERTTQSILGASMGMSMVGAMSRREGPPNASQDGLLYSICGTGVLDQTVATEFTATDMCLSTLYLHELHHRQIKRRTGTGTVRSEQGKSWQQPHQTTSMGSMSPDVGFSQPSTSASVAVERTPLLAPKKS